MTSAFLTSDFKISHRKLAAAIFLTSGTLAWFFLLNITMPDIFKAITLSNTFWDHYNIGQILFFGFSIFWAVVGSFIGGKINRRKLLISWVFLGTFSTIILTAFQGTVFAAISSLLLGMSLGLGLPSSMSLIADYTSVEERARVSGVVILGTFIIAFAVIAITGILNLGILETVLLLAIVRSLSFFALILDKCDAPEQKVAQKPILPSTAYREFLFYLFPWVIFSIVSGLAYNLIPTSDPEIANAVAIGTILRYVIIAVFGLVSGVAADRLGRKNPIIAGLVILGVSFALLGFSFNYVSVLLYLAVSGVAWGSFFVIFLAVPGDLSVPGYSEKFYGLGYILPLGVLFGESSIPGSAFVSKFPASSFCLVLSVIILLSIIPVLLAKETLSTEKIRKRKIKEYMDKIGKLREESNESRNN